MTPPVQGAQAVERAALLLTLIAAADKPPTFTELHNRSGLPRSTTARLLAALENHKLIRRENDGSRGFRLGPALARR